MAEDWGIVSINGLTLADVGASGAVNEGSAKAEADIRQRARTDATPLFTGASPRPRDYLLQLRQATTPLAYDRVMTALDLGGNAWELIVTVPGGALASCWVATKRIEVEGSVRATVTASDPVWRLTIPTAATKIITTAADQALAIPVAGQAEVSPVIRLQPRSPRPETGWAWRQTRIVTNIGANGLPREPVRLYLGDTAALVAAGKARGDGNDLRVFVDGQEVRRSFAAVNLAVGGWGSTTTAVWVILPDRLPVGASVTFDVVYGNPYLGPGPTFAYAERPTFPETTVLNLAQSSNTVWVWDVARTAASAWRGINYVAPSNDDFRVPGSWVPALFWDNKDDFLSLHSTYYEDPVGTPRNVAILNVQRHKQNSIDWGEAAQSEGLFDGVLFSSARGLTQIEFDYRWTNQQTHANNTNGVGRFDVWARATGRDWAKVYTDKTQRSPAWISGIVTRSLIIGSELSDHVGLAVGPYNGVKILRSAEGGRAASAEMHSTLRVTLGTALQLTNGPEEAIYEPAATLRLGGGPGPTPAPPYDEVVIGGIGRRLWIPYNSGAPAESDRLVVDLADGQLKAAIWDKSLVTKRRDVPYGVALRHAERVDGATVVRPAGRVTLRPRVERLINPTFASGIEGWQHDANTAGITATTTWDGSTTKRLKIEVTANTGGVGQFARALANTFLPVRPGDVVVVAADVLTTALNLVPRLEIQWLSAAQTHVGEAEAPLWTVPAANTIYRRLSVGVVPAGVAYARIRPRAYGAAAGVIGTVTFDDISTTGNEAVYEDIGGGAVELALLTWPGYY